MKLDAALDIAWQDSELFGYEYFGPAAPAGHVLNGSRWFSRLPAATAAMDSSVDGYEVYNA